MAKAPATPQADTAAPPGKGKKLLLIVLIVLVVVLIGAVGLVGMLLMKKSGSGSGGDESQAQAPATSAPGTPATVAVDLSRPPSFFALDPFVVNLATGEGDRYLQAVIALRVQDAKTSEGLKGFTPEIRHRVNLILSSKLPSEISTLEGREALALQIADDINEILGFPPPRGVGPRNILGAPTGPIQAVLFNSFIIQ
ncbi:MAG: flagellar basal body-associated protein FliL [Rhodocyclaceae bacterium]